MPLNPIFPHLAVTIKQSEPNNCDRDHQFAVWSTKELFWDLRKSRKCAVWMTTCEQFSHIKHAYGHTIRVYVNINQWTHEKCPDDRQVLWKASDIKPSPELAALTSLLRASCAPVFYCVSSTLSPDEVSSYSFQSSEGLSEGAASGGAASVGAEGGKSRGVTELAAAGSLDVYIQALP